ncbi:WD repeat-containing protein 89-like isoform X2 [Acanthaster planci]|uniref:WD repeat-containing protein 89 n=1 Tax=Acanthaster planci TaxID=133434 RepID=A0A8B7ZHF8_ACAPL|nr:WD repeat-containing protein 89-like isoform X2 [Acanthaster planci]
MLTTQSLSFLQWLAAGEGAFQNVPVHARSGCAGALSASWHTDAKMTTPNYFEALTKLKLGRQTTVGPDNQDTYILEIDAQSNALCRGDPLVAAVCSDSAVHVYSKGTLLPIGTFQGHSDMLSGARFGNRNPYLLFTSSKDGTVRCWDMRTKRTRASQVYTGIEGNMFTSFDVSCNDRILCAGTQAQGDDAYLIFWDCRSTNLLGAYKESHSDDITQVRFHPNKPESLATGSTDGLVCLFDISQSSEEDALVTTLNSESSVSRIGWCGTNSEYLYCLTHTETILIWDAVESTVLTRFDDVREKLAEDDQCKVDYLVDCFYHASLKSLVVVGGSYTGDLNLLAVGRERVHKVRSLPSAHSGVVRCLHWDNMTESLVTGGEDSTLAVWPGKEPRLPKPPSRSAGTTPTSATTPTTPTNPTTPTMRKRRAEKRAALTEDIEVTKRMQRMKVNHSRSATVK